MKQMNTNSMEMQDYIKEMCKKKPLSHPDVSNKKMQWPLQRRMKLLKDRQNIF